MSVIQYYVSVAFYPGDSAPGFFWDNIEVSKEEAEKVRRQIDEKSAMIVFDTIKKERTTLNATSARVYFIRITTQEHSGTIHLPDIGTVNQFTTQNR